MPARASCRDRAARSSRKDGEDARFQGARDSPVAKARRAIDFLEDTPVVYPDRDLELRSLPVPRKVLESVMVDDAWANVLRDAWIVPVTAEFDREAGGFFRAALPAKGIGVVDRAGETTWLTTELVMIPHPVLLDEIDDLRGLAVEIGVTQGLARCPGRSARRAYRRSDHSTTRTASSRAVAGDRVRRVSATRRGAAVSASRCGKLIEAR